MEDKKYYNRDFEDIIISIPSNTIEMKTEAVIYEDGMLHKISCKYNLEDIKHAQNTFEMCCSGDYPTYELTELGKQYIENLKNNIV